MRLLVLAFTMIFFFACGGASKPVPVDSPVKPFKAPADDKFADDSGSGDSFIDDGVPPATLEDDEELPDDEEMADDEPVEASANP